jgi:hypothetical protein
MSHETLKMAYGPPQTNFAGVPKNQKKGSCVSVLNLHDRLWTQRQTQTDGRTDTDTDANGICQLSRGTTV